MGRWRRVLVAAVAWLAVGGLAAQPASAHALVVATNPAAGAVLPRPPPELRVVFSEPVRPLGQGFSLRGGRGRVRLGPVGHPPALPEVLAAAVPRLGDGTYTAVWRIVSVDDGHVEAGSFAFAVGAGSSLGASSPGPPQLHRPGRPPPAGWRSPGAHPGRHRAYRAGTVGAGRPDRPRRAGLRPAGADRCWRGRRRAGR
jgi:methionine-rich copper-binding protein CopC